MNKKGYMKTLEAVFAIIIFLIALFGVLALQSHREDLKPQEIELLQDTILNEIEYNGNYRLEILDNVYPNPSTNVNNFIESSLSNNLDYETVICDDSTNCPSPESQDYLDAKKVYADGLIISGKNTLLVDTTKLFVLFLWNKEVK